MTFIHTTVLLEEATNYLNLKKGDLVIDCTCGGGGHTARLLDQVGPEGKVFAWDRDLEAISFLKQTFQKPIEEGRFILHQGPFSGIASKIKEAGLEGQFSGILADLGVSSPQIDEAQRGFSFSKEGPLDMRMDQSTGKSLLEFLSETTESELSYILKTLGEEPFAKKIASIILQHHKQKPLLSTKELADLIAGNIFYQTKSKKHPATRTFQALRIYLNQELKELESMMDQALQILKPKGRLSIISFHSLEDRIVKDKMKNWSKKDHLPSKLPVIDANMKASAFIIKPFPILPKDEEVTKNPRSRSAKLRVCEKI